MSSKENSGPTQKVDFASIVAAGLDPYDYGLGDIDWKPSGQIYCERLDHPEEVQREEEMLKKQAEEREKAWMKRMARKQKSGHIVTPSEATYMIVKIRLRSGRTYEVAEVKVKDNSNVEAEAESLFDHYYHKLGKRFIHIKKPTHHAIRCSVVDDLFISYR